MQLKDLSALRPEIPGYGELRLHHNKQWAIAMVKGSVVRNSVASSGGLSARLRRGYSWGMASSPELSPESLRAVLKNAAENAVLLDARFPAPMPDMSANPGHLLRDHRTAKTRLSQKEKLDFLAELDAYIVKKYPKLLSRTVAATGLDQEKSIVTADGAEGYAYIPRTHVFVNLSVERDGAPIDLRSPTIGGLGEFEDFCGDPVRFFPVIDELYEAVMKKKEGLYAEAGVKPCILAPDLAGILAHEAVGHTVEADLVLGGSIAGPMLNRPVASPLVSMTDFAHTAFGQTCEVPVYVDDEGVECVDAPLIRDGILVGYMHNRESAHRYGVQPAGNGRAFAFSDEPLIRMRNTCILPGTSKLADMIASVEDGYYLANPGNGQADMTSEFMFAVTMGYEIKNGRLGRALLDTTVSGVAFDMLKTVTAVSDDLHWVSSGMCGKKQPAPVSMGGPAILCKINLGGR